MNRADCCGRWCRVTLLLALVACTSDREHDCGEVKKILEARDPLHPPRRYYDYDKAPKPSVNVRDMSPYERLKKLDYRDAEVKRAALEVASEAGWTFYSPFDTNAPESAADRLRKLCGITPIIVQ